MVILKRVLHILDKIVEIFQPFHVQGNSHITILFSQPQRCGCSYQLMSKLRWCKISFFPFSLVQNYPGAPHFLLDLSFKYFLTHSKGRNCLLGLISVSFSFIQPQNIFLPTPPVSILLSSLSNSLKQQTDLFTGHKSLRQKKVFTFCCVN